RPFFEVSKEVFRAQSRSERSVPQAHICRTSWPRRLEGWVDGARIRRWVRGTLRGWLSFVAGVLGG
ncbi:hypothetical protein, partial [Rhodococcus opacus]|uniref:hypothetical protein n=1 Tax=Rhodococcus opacus TaxID=37919 RepID=UPI001A7E17BC